MKLLKRDSDDLTLFHKGKLIHKTNDAHGTILVLDYPKYRVMTFDSVCEQSCMNREHPEVLPHLYTQAMILVLAFITPQHITLLGLGGGCLVRAIHHVLPDVIIEAVEQRESVIDACKTFFSLPDASQIKTHVADGGDFLSAMQPSSTDIIFADMYGEYEMDPLQEQASFVISAYHALTEKGCLVFNFHSLPDKDSEFFSYLYELYSDVLICTPSPGNYVLFASKTRLKDDIASYFTNYKAIDAKIQGQGNHLFRNIIRSKR